MFNESEKYLYNKGFRMNKAGEFFNPRGKIVKGSLSQGYRKYKKRIEGDCNKYKYIKFSRFQAFCKFGDKIYEDGIVVRHLNGIRDDDSWSNIEIGTQSQNMLDRPAEERREHAMKATKAMMKYKNVNEIIKYHEKNGKSYKKTMKKFNISSTGTLHYILNNRTIK